MNSSVRSLRVTAMMMAFVFIVAACGGTDDGSMPVEEAAGSSEPIPTTTPLQEPAEDETELTTEPTADDIAVDVPAGEFETIVLHVKDDVHPDQTIQVFRAPTGLAEDVITLVDVNEIDGTVHEYPLTGNTHFENRLALMVNEYDETGNYARVHMPVRPNGTTAWVQTAFFDEMRHQYRIEVHVASNTVRVFDGDTVIKESSAVTGRESRPTPVLRSYIDEKIPGADISPAYGSWILSVAAFSESLGTFDGGMPKLALHGTNQEDLIGQSVSSGCVRVPNDIIEFIADTVPVGTPVDFIR